MQSFVRQSPLRTFKMEEADLIFIAANLSGMCWAGNQFRASSLFVSHPPAPVVHDRS